MKDNLLNNTNSVSRIINREYGLISTSDLQNNIRKYRKIDLRYEKDEVILSHLRKIILVKFNLIYKYFSGHDLYRIRKLNSDGKKLLTKSDLLYPSADKVKYMGRLNNPHESLLYTGLSPYCLIEEVKVNVDEHYTLIKYKVKEGETLRVMSIGLYEEDHNRNLGDNPYFSDLRKKLTRKAQTNFDIINDFLNSEFTKDVGIGTEFLYRTSNLISKHFCESEIDGFVYPSIGAKKGYNVALMPDAVDKKIDIVGLQIHKLVSFRQDGTTVTGTLGGVWSDEIIDGEIIYRPTDEERTFSFRDQL